MDAKLKIFMILYNQGGECVVTTDADWKPTKMIWVLIVLGRRKC